MELKRRNILGGLLKVIENDTLERVMIVVLRMNTIYPSDVTHVWSVPMIDNKGTFGLLEFLRVRWGNAVRDSQP